MKKLLNLGIVGLLSTAVSAQISFGIHAAGFKSWGKLSDDAQPEIASKNAFGGKFGVLVDIPISKAISFMPEINSALRTTKFSQQKTQGTESISEEAMVKPFFIEIPLNVSFKKTSAKGTFFAGLGPVLSLGMGGKYKDTEEYTQNGVSHTQTWDNNIAFDGKEDATDDKIHFKPLEIGINAFVGYKLKNGLFGRIVAMQGLSNLSVEEGSSYKSGYAGIGIGYFFGSK